MRLSFFLFISQEIDKALYVASYQQDIGSGGKDDDDDNNQNGKWAAPFEVLQPDRIFSFANDLMFNLL